jgi:hypothetical protein
LLSNAVLSNHVLACSTSSRFYDALQKSGLDTALEVNFHFSDDAKITPHQFSWQEIERDVPMLRPAVDAQAEESAAKAGGVSDARHRKSQKQRHRNEQVPATQRRRKRKHTRDAPLRDVSNAAPASSR